MHALKNERGKDRIQMVVSDTVGNSEWWEVIWQWLDTFGLDSAKQVSICLSLIYLISYELVWTSAPLKYFWNFYTYCI